MNEKMSRRRMQAQITMNEKMSRRRMQAQITMGVGVGGECKHR
jgi:hypothetical protein